MSEDEPNPEITDATNEKSSGGSTLTALLTANNLARVLAATSSSMFGLPTITLGTPKPQTIVVSSDPLNSDLHRQQISVLERLAAHDIDPALFDVMLSNELDRKLKQNFGAYFLILTAAFTLLSYVVIILNGACNWKISQTAITALIVETPIQFIGLLYIIARNLFPQSASSKVLDALHATGPKPPKKPKAPTGETPPKPTAPE